MVAMSKLHELEIGGGQVEKAGARGWQLTLPACREGYADAQLDDYADVHRRNYPWHPGTTLSLVARFSHPAGTLVGTAGFGFWNAPFGPGTGLLPALPQATWFFYGSEPTDLPLAPLGQPGRGWFAATIDATTPQALAWTPLAPVVLLLNQFPAVRGQLWPLVRQSLQVTFQRLEVDMTSWHKYTLSWQEKGCFFGVDGQPILQTPLRPTGPLGFVTWIDNQYLRATVTGRFGWGTLPVQTSQWLEIRQLELASEQ